ncbi:MAG TPA: heme-binding domain-containing protein [Acidimicrobiia bacterium]|jgi:hypothetical protein
MRRVLRWGLAGAAVVIVGFGLIQLIPYRISNPRVRTSIKWDSARTQQLVVAACYDCHSNETKKPWYASVAPVSWWLKHHVDEGRARLNFSEWDPNHHRGGDQIARTIERGSMPPTYYTWFGLHSNAKLSAADKAALVKGLQNSIGPAVGVPDFGGGGRR